MSVLHLHENKNDFYGDGFALSLALNRGLRHLGRGLLKWKIIHILHLDKLVDTLLTKAHFP